MLEMISCHRHHHNKQPYSLAVLIGLQVALILGAQFNDQLLARGEKVIFEVPNSKRTEGRVTIEYVRNDETIRYQLAFSEVVDADTQRSRVSIGYVSYDPTDYFSRAGNILTVNKEGVCVCYRQAGYKFVPELDWFLRLTYTQEELDKALAPSENYYIGPTGIALMLAKYQTKFSHKETHRNVECHVTSAHYSRVKAKEILYEILVPNLKMFDSPKMNFFSVRETIKNAVDENGDKFSTTMTIDYYYTEEIDKTNHHQLERLEMDLNLPFGKGCSAHLQPTRPTTSSQSFIMAYAHNVAQSIVSLAYDHKSNYLRKEIVGRSVAIWDLNEDLLYHVDQKIDGKLYNSVDIEVPLEACSVLSVANGGGDSKKQEANEARIMLPFEQSGSSVDVLEFLGAKELYYMGQATVRDLPCQIFETILAEPPRIFDVDLRVSSATNTLNSDGSPQFDYIVQFHIFKTNAADRVTQLRQAQAATKDNQQQQQPWTVMINDQFWPARISLFRRHRQTGATVLFDQLDISDFHWGLFGWTKKPSELFMLPECFSDEDEQLRIDLALEFDRLNLDDNHKVLRHSKYKLEKELMDDLFNLMGVSRLHLTEFQLNLRPHDVLANLVISDRIDSKKLTYFGVGDLPQANSYLNNRILLQDLASTDYGGEPACIMLAAHVAQVSMVIFCPRQSESQGPTCTAIFGEQQPVVKRPSFKDPLSSSLAGGDSTSCQVYRFEPGTAPKAATGDPQKIKLQLLNHRFSFDSDTSPKVTFNGLIRDFDVSRELQLITISNYKYAAQESQKLVRTFDTMPYESLGDCTRMCNFDAACKSYSYCQDKSQLATSRCVLASLDLRQNSVENQLVSAKLTEANQVIVRDLEQQQHGERVAAEYSLDLKGGCNIYEKNPLDSFTQTDELISIDQNVAKQFLSLSTVAECARWVLSVEEQLTDYQGAMFAYCANSNTCLIDEDLFASFNSPKSSQLVDEDNDQNQAAENPTSNLTPDDSRELSCQIYRKRYQNYFHISHKVIKRRPQSDAKDDPETSNNLQARAISGAIKQVELQFNSVEQCARACWDSFGHNCVSFDFCLPQSCLINLLNEETLSGANGDKSAQQMLAQVELETRTGCLHYERDLKWDQLRRDHLIGSHTPLNLDQMRGGNGGNINHESPSKVMANFGLFVFTSILFVVGLAVGRIFNDRLDNRSTSGFLGAHFRGGPRTNGTGESNNSSISASSIVQRMSNSSKFNIENEIYEDPSAIRMQDLGPRRNEQSTADGNSLSQSQEQQTLSTPPPPPAGHIEVPDLMSV